MKKQLTSEDWKFCAVVDLGIETIDEEQRISFNEHFIRIFKPSDKVVQGNFVAEVYTLRSTYPDSETAFHSSLEILNKILARISIASFRYCKVIAPVGVTQFKAERNKPFMMLLSVNFMVPPPKKVFSVSKYLHLFSTIDEQELNDSISELSLAINTSSIYHKFSHYYNCVERIAHLLSTENVNYECAKCGELNEISVKATGTKMRELFKNIGYESKIFNKCRSIRGKLAHGSCERTRDLNLEVLEYLPIIEKVTLQVLEENTSLNGLKSDIISQSFDQFIEITGKKKWKKNYLTNSAYEIVSHKINFNFRINEIGESEETQGFITENLPTYFNLRNLKIFPYAWPY